MMHHDFLSKLFLGETTEIEQWPDTFQCCSEFIASQFLALDHHEHALLKGLSTQRVWYGACADALPSRD